jgi:muconolactone delta-isomerase
METKMQIIALLRRRTEKFADADFAPVLPDESQQRRVLYAEGLIRQIWNRTDVPGTAFLFEAADLAEANRQLETLPLVKTGMMEITTLTGLAPYPGFGPARK